MKFSQLANYFSLLEATSSRLKITEILATLFKEAKAEEIDKVCYLALGKLASGFEGIEFNLADKMMIRVLALAFDKKETEIKNMYKRMGDLGNVGYSLFSNHQAPDLEVSQVFKILLEIALESGQGSVERKVSKMADLLQRLDGFGVKYAIRIPLGRLRLGFSDKTVLDGLSWMLSGDKKQRFAIEAAYNVRADVAKIAKLIKSKGLNGLKNIEIELGTPVMPALCQRLPTAEEIIKKMGKVAVEPKYDGTRLQMHFGRRFVRLFTRGLENVSPMFPDLSLAAEKEIRAKEVILDGEVIGVDPKSGKFLPFQETIKRKRKYDIDQKIKEIPLKFMAFDILYENGKDLIHLPLFSRRKILEKTVKGEGSIIISPQILTEKATELRFYHQEQLEKGLEGVVAKKWEAAYEPGRTGFTWVKLKSEKGKKGAGLSDTLDCVVMGFSAGKGKRASFGIGEFLVGIREEKKERYLTVSKIGTGLTDEQFKKMYRLAWAIKTKTKPPEYEVHKNLTPDVWCLPKIVVEIEADNITLSSINTSGFGLRFPRLVRFREDKSPRQSTTFLETKKIYQFQK